MEVLSHRQNKILTLAGKNGRVDVEELSTTFEVSPQTIRKDLTPFVTDNSCRESMAELLWVQVLKM